MGEKKVDHRAEMYKHAVIGYKNQLMMHLRIFHGKLGFWPEVDFENSWLAIHGGSLNEADGVTCFASSKALETARDLLNISDKEDQRIREEIKGRKEYHC